MNRSILSAALATAALSAGLTAATTGVVAPSPAAAASCGQGYGLASFSVISRDRTGVYLQRNRQTGELFDLWKYKNYDDYVRGTPPRLGDNHVNVIRGDGDGTALMYRSQLRFNYCL